jgi:magnesium transporter
MNVMTAQGRINFEIASEHAAVRVPIANPAETIGGVRRSLAGAAYEMASHIVVCDHGRFVGILTVEDLFAAPEDSAVASVMDRDPPTIAPGADQEVAAWHAVKHGEAALSVVDQDGRFLGIIPPHRLLAVLLQEHNEDMARIGGFLKNSSAALRASEEPVHRRFWHRVPWLLLGLAGVFLAADIIGLFEASLQEHLILAFFIPGIVYLADAVGTQTEMVLVRGLSVGVPVRRVVGREILSGITIGLALGAAAFPIVLWRWGDWEIALGMGISIFAACSIATLIAMLLPWIFDQFDLDPAFGSGPLATIIQDLLSVLIYFAIMTAVVF